MFEDYFKTSEEAGSLYRVEDLLGVVKVSDTAQDLKRFVNKWDATLAGMATTPPEEAVLRDILLRQIRPSQLLKYGIRCSIVLVTSEKPYEKSFVFLHQSMKNLIDRERLSQPPTVTGTPSFHLSTGDCLVCMVEYVSGQQVC